MEERLPEGWVKTTLGEIRFDLAKGVEPNKYPEHFFELYSVPNFDLGIPEILQGKVIKSNKQIIEVDTVLLCKINPRINRAWIVGNFSEHMKIASTEWLPFFKVPDILPPYLCYYLQLNTLRDYFAASASGVGGSLMRINDRIVASYPFPLPPLPEQNRIVAAIEQQFTRLDSAVASLQSAKARVKQYRTSLLKAAVEGELTKEWRAAHPAEETGEQLLARILDERRMRWEEEQLAKMRDIPKDEKWKQAYKEPQGPDIEQLPELPEGWCWATVEQLASMDKYALAIGPFGSNLKVENYRPEGVPLVFVRNIRSENFNGPNTKYITFEKAEELQAHKVVGGDILITKMGDPPGDACLYPENRPPAIITADCIKWTLSPILSERKFFVKAINSSIVRDQILYITKGVAQQKVSLQRFSRIAIPLPPFAEQEQIVAEVEARLSNIAQMEETIEANLKRAEHERQSILREAFTGRLVPQDPEDEPASILLERVREERKKREEAEKVARASRKEIQMEVAKTRRAGKAGLYTTLVGVGHSLPPDDLFKRAGLKADEQPESVEVFYEELDADVELALIAEMRPDYEHVLLKAQEPSAEALARMTETKVATQAQEAEQSEKTIDAPMLWEI